MTSTFLSSDLSPIKKGQDLTETPSKVSMKSVEEAEDEGLKNSQSDPTSSAVKRSSVDGEEPAVEKPKKQFKRRNVALYSALGADDA